MEEGSVRVEYCVTTETKGLYNRLCLRRYLPHDEGIQKHNISSVIREECKKSWSCYLLPALRRGVK